MRFVFSDEGLKKGVSALQIPSDRNTFSPRARWEESKPMADFVQNSKTKPAFRELASPIADKRQK
jgi:hypothetical protein